MRSGNGIIRLGWACFWLILLAGGLYALGKQDQDAKPDPQSYKPGGAAAFAKLLEANGYQVQITDSIPSKLDPGTTVLAFIPMGDVQDQEQAAAAVSPFANDTSEGVVATTQLVEKHLQEGGNAILLSYSPDEILPDIEDATPVQYNDSFNRTYRVLVPRNANIYLTGDLVDSSDQRKYLGWRIGNTDHGVELAKSAHGTLATIPAGQGALNRFIDLGDNARFFVDIVSAVTPKGGTILFETASIDGAATPSVLQLIGPWAQGTWWQLVFLLIVVIFTLGRRFGLAETTPLRQQASRELLDGVSDTFARSRAAKAALIRVTQDVDARLRKELKLPEEGSREKRNERLPEGLANALTACENALIGPVRQDRATDLAARLEAEAAAFLGITSRMNRGRRRVK